MVHGGPRAEREAGGERSRAPEPPDLSVVVVNRNTRALLAELLDSLEALADGIAFEVILVDNGSTDGSLDGVEGRDIDLRLLRNAENCGYARANNQGIAAAGGRYILLLNSDTVVPAGALEGLVAWMDSHPRAGIAGPALRTPGGDIQRTCRSFATPWRWFCDLSGLGGLFKHSRLFGNLVYRFDHRSTAPVDWLIGAALVARREAVEQVGLLDERFWIYCNDSDWCRRFRSAGWDIWFVHSYEIVHHGGATIALESRSGELQREMIRNQLDLQRKYYGGAGAGWLRFLLVVGLGLRGLRLVLLGLGRPDTDRSRLRRDFLRTAGIALRGIPRSDRASGRRAA